MFACSGTRACESTDSHQLLLLSCAKVTPELGSLPEQSLLSLCSARSGWTRRCVSLCESLFVGPADSNHGHSNHVLSWSEPCGSVQSWSVKVLEHLVTLWLQLQGSQSAGPTNRASCESSVVVSSTLRRSFPQKRLPFEDILASLSVGRGYQRIWTQTKIHKIHNLHKITSNINDLRQLNCCF